MKVDETKMYTFHLPFMSGLVSINVPANNQPEAAQVIKDWMSEAQKELALMFPQVAPEVAPQTELNALQIGLISDLVTQIPGCESVIGLPELKNKVKELTDFDLTLDNVKVIIPKLESLKNGHGKKKG